MTGTLAQRFADYAANLKYEDLTLEAIHEVKRRVIDSFATAAGAMDSEAYLIARKVAGRMQSTPGASLLNGGKSSIEWATFVNGLLIRYLDFNDTYLSKEPAHPSDNLAPILAVGEAYGATGKEVITAAVLAYEIQCRLCDACSLRAQGVDHVTYGAISSAVAAAKLMKLDASKIAHAIGLAGVSNVALRQTRSGELSMWKGCAFANAARNGVFAALLAADGMTGPAPIFEGDLGFMKLVTRSPFTVAPMGGEAGNSDGFMINKTYIKNWPAEYHSQSAIDAALQLRKEMNFDVSKVKSIDIYTFEASYNIIGKYAEAWKPKTRETADHSLPYCTAVALFDGHVGLEQFAPERFTKADIVDFTAKVKIHLDDELSKGYPQGIPNRIVVTNNDGQIFTKEVAYPRGHAENPMHDAEVKTKFRITVEPRFGKKKAEIVLEKCWELDKLTEVGQLITLLSPS